MNATPTLRRVQQGYTAGFRSLASRSVTGLAKTRVTPNVLTTVGVSLCLAAAVLVPFESRNAWFVYWIAAGIFAWTSGDIYYTFALQHLASQPFPSLADAGYLGFYLPVLIGLGLLVRSSVLDFGGVVWLDGLIGGFTVASLAAWLVLGVWAPEGNVRPNGQYRGCD